MRLLVLVLFCLISFATNAQYNGEVEKLLESRNRGEDKYILHVQLHNNETGELLNGAYITLLDKKTNEYVTEYSIDGQVNFVLYPGADYEMFVDKKGYLNHRAGLQDCQTSKSIDYVFCANGFDRLNYVHGDDMNAKLIHAEIGIEEIVIGKTFKLENIYYDLAKWNIRPDAARELNKLVRILNDNPEIIIELGSHTDSRGSNESNQTLSQKRAESAVEYIISKGISQHRISAKGYGEKVLVNRCSNGVKCSSYEHQQNRRTEFKITSVSGEYEPITRW